MKIQLEYWNIILGIVIVIIVYFIYLNNKNIEGFEDNSNSSNQIEQLINSQENNNFNTRIWDNQNYLSSLYKTNIPNTLLECPEKSSNKVLNSCPISIWRPNMADGYESVGDVLTRTLKNPSTELINDVRKPKVPGVVTEKLLSTMSVSGIETKEVEDFTYIGGFGDGLMIDRLEKNDLYYRLVKQFIFYLTNFNKTLNDKITDLNQKVQSLLNNTTTIFSSYVEQLITANPIYPSNPMTIIKMKEFMENPNNSVKSILTDLANTPLQIKTYNLKNVETTPASFKYDINIKRGYIKNPYKISDLVAGIPPNILEELLKNYDTKSEIDGIPFDNYDLKIDNLNIIDDKILNMFTSNNTYDFDDPIHFNIENKNKHYLLESKPGIQISINVSEQYAFGENRYNGWTARWDRRHIGFKTRNNIIKFGKTTEIDKVGLSKHDPEMKWDNIKNKYTTGHNSKILNFNSISILTHPNLISSMYTQLTEDADLKEKYNNVIKILNKIKEIYPQMNKNTYNRLSIWQPTPPAGYVSLGFIFTNDDKDTKPSKQLIKCIPQDCAKSFKRRPWSPKEDIIFRYTDNSQNLVFYKNPFLNTVVVMDEMKQNGIFKGKTPSSLKYRNEKGSLNWECYDIVPCIKGCDYVKNLEIADKNSKQMCKSLNGIENKFFDKTETKQTIQDEENKLKSLLKGKKQYLDTLMTKLDKMMSEDELYKILTQGLNRYKIKKDLEDQRKLHGDVADKLMRTRGLEIGWNAPDDMGKFKDLVKRLVVAQYTVSGQKKDCPVCKLPDTSDFVQMKDLELCYGCLEDVVRELIGKKKSAGEPVPQELLDLEKNM